MKKVFVQSGNQEQSDANGMMGYVYTFGSSTDGRNFVILDNNGEYSGPHWSIGKDYSTPFRLELIYEQKKKSRIDFFGIGDPIPF